MYIGGTQQTHGGYYSHLVIFFRFPPFRTILRYPCHLARGKRLVASRMCSVPLWRYGNSFRAALWRRMPARFYLACLFWYLYLALVVRHYDRQLL